MKHSLLLFVLTVLSSATLLAGNPCGSLAVDSVQVTDVSCNGGSDGQIVVYASGGTGPYTYSNGQSSTGSPLTVLQDFTNNVIYNSGNVLGSYYSPATCSPGNYFAYSASGGCTGGSADYNGRVALPNCNVSLNASKPLPTEAPRNPVEIGDHIKQRRMKLGLRALDVANYIGVTEDTIYNWEYK